MHSVFITTDVESRSARGVQHYVTGRWFSPAAPVSSTNKTDRIDIAEILLKVALNTIKQTNIHTLVASFSQTLLRVAEQGRSPHTPSLLLP